MASNLELARETKCNKEFNRRSSFGIFGPEQILPLGVSTIVGVLIAVIFQLNLVQMFPHMVWPFIGYMIAVGKDKRVFYSKWSRTPKWRRSNRRHSHYFKKEIIGRIIR